MGMGNGPGRPFKGKARQNILVSTFDKDRENLEALMKALGTTNRSEAICRAVKMALDIQCPTVAPQEEVAVVEDAPKPTLNLKSLDLSNVVRKYIDQGRWAKDAEMAKLMRTNFIKYDKELKQMLHIPFNEHIEGQLLVDIEEELKKLATEVENND